MTLSPCSAVETIETLLPIHLKDLKFEEFFEWLGRSVSIVSTAEQGDKVTLDKDVSGWLDIDV